MFAPRPDVTVREMLRVLKPGGVIALSTWPPEMFVGRMFAVNGKYGPPPPPGVSPPGQWGDIQTIRERLGAAVTDIRFARDVMLLQMLSPQHYRVFMETNFGPAKKLMEVSISPTRLRRRHFAASRQLAASTSRTTRCARTICSRARVVRALQNCFRSRLSQHESTNRGNMKQYCAEFLGTFWLVLGGCCSAVLAAAFPQVGIGLLGVALAFGLTVLTMAYAIGHISGCHLNPAVSIGLCVGGRFPAAKLAPYVVAQVLGAIAAGGVLYVIASGAPGFNVAAGFASNGFGAHSPGGYCSLPRSFARS
jgi:hypothetical protein